MPEKEDRVSQKNGQVAQVNRAAAAPCQDNEEGKQGRQGGQWGGLHERSDTPALHLDSEKDTGELLGGKDALLFLQGAFSGHQQENVWQDYMEPLT